MKTLSRLLLLLLPSLLFANNEFNQQFDIDLPQHHELADRISLYYTTDMNLDASAQQQELESLQQQINQIRRFTGLSMD